MYQLPPIKHAGLPRPDRGRSPSHGEPEESLRTPEPGGRRVSEPLTGTFKPTEIHVTSDDYPDTRMDLDYISVRGAMGSPVPRSLGEDMYALDKSLVDSNNGGHPKITIDICADSAKTTLRGPELGSSFGQPVARSLSVNNLLMAPSQVMIRHNTLPPARPRGKDRGAPGNKMPLSICRSEGNIPLIVCQSQVQNRSVFQGLTTGDTPRWPRQELRHVVSDGRSVEDVRRLSAEHVSTNAVDTIASDVTCFDLDDRPNTPTPDRISRLSRDLCSGSPVSPLTTSATPPASPHWSPNTSPKSRITASLTPPMSPDWPQGQSPRYPIRMQLTPPLSPIRRSKSVPKSHAPSVDSSTRLTDGSPRSPGRSPMSPEGSPRSSRGSPRLPGRLLPLRCDRQEV